MFALAGLGILHASLAAITVEVMLRVWRVQDPGERASLRWASLVVPLVCGPVFALAAPIRAGESFSTVWAVFAGRHWNEPTVAGVGLASLATAVLMALGFLLYLRDAWPFLSDRAGRSDDHDIVTDPALILRAAATIQDVRRRDPALPEPRLVVLARATPVLLCRGVEQPVIVLSTGTLERLDDEELAAALTHELSHARHRDPLRGWVLMVVRTLACVNPATQIVARQIVLELEHRADLAAATLAGPAALGRAIASLSEAPDAETDLRGMLDGMTRTDRFLDRAHREAVGERCERVFSHPAPPRSPVAAYRLALLTTTLAMLLFLVV